MCLDTEKNFSSCYYYRPGVREQFQQFLKYLGKEHDFLSMYANLYIISHNANKFYNRTKFDLLPL